MITRILRNLTGPGLDDPDPERRIEALSRQEPPLSPEALGELARTDPEPSVRAASIERIMDARVLLELMDTEMTETKARERLNELLAGGLDADALAAEIGADLAALRHLLDASPAEGALRLLEGLDDEEVLADVAAHHRTATVRAAAARRVTSETHLRSLSRAVRERDRDVARLVRERLDRLREARAALDGAVERLTRLSEDAALLERREDDPHAAERSGLLRRQRDEAEAERMTAVTTLTGFAVESMPAPEALAALDASLAAVDARIASAREKAEAEATERDRIAAGLEDTRAMVASLERLRDQVTERIAAGGAVSAERGPLRSALDMEDARWADAIAALPDAAERASLVEQRDTVRAALDTLMGAFDAWLAAGDAPKVDAEPAAGPDAEPDPGADPGADPGDRIPRTRDESLQLETRLAALRSAQEALDDWIEACAWPAALPAPENLRDARTRRDEITGRLDTLEGARRGLTDRIGKLAARIDRALDARKLKPVTGMVRDLKRQLGALPEIDEHMRQRLETIEARVEELRDWEYFATAPKRQALCEEMERIADDETLDAAQRGQEVKRLRGEWNALGPVRGRAEATEGAALAERFDAAAERAFAPARAHYEAEAARRAEHTANRRRICEELEQFLNGYDWQQADWKAVERIYRSARNEWQRFEDVDREGRDLGKRYHRLTRDLKHRLEARWKENIAAKEALVAAAQALVVDAGPVPDAARQAKALQAEWKHVDITPRSVDRRLWKDFRAACDAVFKGLDAVRDEAKAAFEPIREQVAEATRALATALAAIRDQAAAPDAAALSALPEKPLRDAIDALERARPPQSERRQSERVLGEARALLREVAEARRHLKARSRRANLMAVLDHDVALTQAEVEGADTPPTPDLAAPMRAALARRASARSGDAERREACVDLELALGLESPAEDGDLRLARQVARLNSGMRGDATARDTQASIEAAIADLLACPGKGPESVELAQRARHALDAGSAAA